MSLDLGGCYKIKFKAVLELVAANSCSLHVLRLQRSTNDVLDDGVDVDSDLYNDIDFYGHKSGELEALLQAAPALQVLEADLSPSYTIVGDDVRPLTPLLRREGVFKPLRLGHLYADVQDEDELLELLGCVADTSMLSGLKLCSSTLHLPAVLDAVVDAVVASKLALLTLYQCDLGPASATALVRLLSSPTMTRLCIAFDGSTMLFNEDAAVLLANALRTNRTLTSLEFTNCDLWRAPAAGAALLSSLVAHPSLRALTWYEEYIFQRHPAALASNVLHALLAADAPALKFLWLGALGEDGLGPLLDALPRNTHLHTLLFDLIGLSDVFVHDRMLPAVRANTSLRQLLSRETWTGFKGRTLSRSCSRQPC